MGPVSSPPTEAPNGRVEDSEDGVDVAARYGVKEEEEECRHRTIPESPAILRVISSVSALTMKKNPQHTKQHPQDNAKKIGRIITKVVKTAASNRQHNKMNMKLMGIVLMMVDTEELLIMVPNALFISASVRVNK